MTRYRDALEAGVYQSEPTEEQEVNGDHACEVCGRTFKSEHGLNIHRTKMHENAEEESEDEPALRDAGELGDSGNPADQPDSLLVDETE